MISRTSVLLVIHALRAWTACRPVDATWFTTCSDARIGRALSAVHPILAWTLERMAAGAGMSRSAFASRLALLRWEGTMRYLLRSRMTSCERLLRSGGGGIGVGDVGRRVGPESEAGFSRALKACFGRPPKTARRARDSSLVKAPGSARAGEAAKAPSGRPGGIPERLHQEVDHCAHLR